MRGGRQAFPWFIAWRFLRGRRSRLLAGTARAALAAIAIGVMAMVIAMALMTGYRDDLQRKLVGNNAAVVVYPVGEETVEEELRVESLIGGIEGVTGVRRVAYGQGLLASSIRSEGIEITIRGLDERGLRQDSTPVEYRLEGPEPLAEDESGVAGVLLGGELLESLEIGESETLRLTLLGFEGGRPRFRYRSVRVAGTFTTGFSEFDRAWIVADRDLVEQAAGASAGARLYEVQIENLQRASEIAAIARQELGPGYVASDWEDLNRELFTALKTQQIALFFVLGLIVLVSTFNVASTLVVLVRERMREIGVLAALGLDAASLRRVFFIYGGALSLLGVFLGTAAGVSISWLLTEFEIIRFDAEVAAIYFIRSVPFQVRMSDLVAVVTFTAVVTLVACWLPARRAGRVDPAYALRYE